VFLFVEHCFIVIKGVALVFMNFLDHVPVLFLNINQLSTVNRECNENLKMPQFEIMLLLWNH